MRRFQFSDSLKCRGRLSGKPVESLTKADNHELSQRISKLYSGKKPGNHMANFFQCLENRQQLVSDGASHHRRTSIGP